MQNICISVFSALCTNGLFFAASVMKLNYKVFQLENENIFEMYRDSI